MTEVRKLLTDTSLVTPTGVGGAAETRWLLYRSRPAWPKTAVRRFLNGTVDWGAVTVENSSSRLLVSA